MRRVDASDRSVFLHIGEPKTGTTHLQQILWTNRQQLLAHGVIVPGKRPVAHWAAAQDLRQVAQPDNDPFGSYAGAWDRLAAEALRAPRSAVISHELISAVDLPQATRAVESLGAAEVHVVLTVRDIATLLPAEWQETVKHRNTRPWRDWLTAVIDEESIAADRRQWWFWRVHDTLEICRMWSRVLPPERLHLITVPSGRTNPGLLWERFARAIGVPPEAVDGVPKHNNPSLSLSETEFLRRLNAELPEHLPDWFYVRAVKDGLAHEISAARTAPPADRLHLPADREEWAAKYAEALIADLQRSDHDIVGDLAELLPPALPAHRPEPALLDEASIAAAGVTASVDLLVQLAAEQGVLLAGAKSAAPTAQAGPVKRALIAASNRSRALHRLRRGYWQLANAVRRLRKGDRWRAVEDRNLE
ncbi:MAG: hypothetical protein QOH89_1430 [Pseudonocardiales bacterium]|jgi:hypothetical protein|nr:hypothetical protein [Pseudonocardiales bacterium]MDT4940022.1 hypothetical protein [Pseudonocardiales bacterium]